MTPKEKAHEIIDIYAKKLGIRTDGIIGYGLLNSLISKALKEQAKEICELIMKKPKCMCASLTHTERTNSIKRKIVEQIKQKYLGDEK